jgi:hypothetical protein
MKKQFLWASLCLLSIGGSSTFLFLSGKKDNKELQNTTMDLSVPVQPIALKNMEEKTSGNEKVDQHWLDQAYKNIEKEEYQIQWQEDAGALQSPNRKQNLRATYRPGRFTLAPRIDTVGTTQWKIDFNLQGIYRNENRIYAVTENSEQEIFSNKLVYHFGKEYSVEYMNDQEGVRQNFIVHRKPFGEGLLSVKLDIETDLIITQPHRDELHFSIQDVLPALKKQMTYNQLKVWDSNHQELIAWMDYSDHQLAIVVEDRNAVYPLTIDPLSSTADWTEESDQASALFGSSMSSAGDVNGDGFSDVIVGAPFYDNGQTNEGRVFVFHGSASGLSGTADWTEEIDQANVQFGSSVATVGDVNGDGYSDIVIGVPLYGGNVYVYHGSSTGLPASANWTKSEGYQFGYSVSGAGDVNGDGYSDLIVGDPGYVYTGSPSTTPGKAYVYHGSSSGLSGTSNWSYTTSSSNYDYAMIGSCVASAGDVNGDGYSDVIVGMENRMTLGRVIGEAKVFHGSSLGLSGSSSWTETGELFLSEPTLLDARFGKSVACAGDLNGDGYSDIIVGAPSFDTNPDWSVDNMGKVYVYHGSSSGLSPDADWTKAGTGTIDNEYFGASVACAGDINGDGYADIVIGVPGYVTGSYSGGRVYFYNGSSGGLGSTANWTQNSSQSGANMGACVSSAGDVNGDGYSDLLIASPNYDNGQTDEGRVFLYYGKPGNLSSVNGYGNVVSESQEYSDFAIVSTAGDVNGDGYSDIIVGAPSYDNGQTNEGKAYVYHGAAGGLSITPSWTAESNQALAYFGRAVSSGGDVNGDGYADVIVGALNYDNGQTDEGRVYLYNGSSSGVSSTASWTAESNQAYSEYTKSISSAGDVNGDGYSDIIVGAPVYDNGQTNEGKVFVYYGSSSGPSGSADWSMEYNQANASFGNSVSNAGDVNGDGYSDVIVGAPSYANGQSQEGGAFVYYGSSMGLSNTADWTAESNWGSSMFGFSVSTAGDVNGDGYSDVAITAPRYQLRVEGDWIYIEGRVFAYYGSSTGLSSSPDWSADRDAVEYSSRSIIASSAGDVNGDGYSDVLFGDNAYNSSHFILYYGSSSGLSSLNTIITEGYNHLGALVSGAGDINGDGYSDVITSYYAWDPDFPVGYDVRVYYGNEKRCIRNNLRLYNTNLTDPISQSNAANSQIGAGLYAKSFIGRMKGKMVWETKDKGSAFSTGNSKLANSTSYSGQQSSYTDLGIAGAEMKNLVDKEGTDFDTKLRVRVKYSPVTAITGQVYGPWRYSPSYLQGSHSRNSANGGKISISESDGTFETAGQYNIKTYPNPVKDKLYVEIPEGFDNMLLELKDISGQVIMKNRMEGIVLENLDVSSLETGIYFLVVSYNGEILKTEKLIKQ